jgi:hypothetical protein
LHDLPLSSELACAIGQGSTDANSPDETPFLPPRQRYHGGFSRHLLRCPDAR